jgi:cyclopropane fatty-acyl-phospholipid synthase-like methyltransferase
MIAHKCDRNSGSGPTCLRNDRRNFTVDLDAYRKNLLKYTIKAFRMLPKMKEPRILDIGCGSGVPTMELARLSKGDITGIEIDQTALNILNARIRNAHLAGRVRTINRSLLDMNFPYESFDIIWSEGAVFVMGYEKSLVAWRRFIIPGGFLVVHDAAGDIAHKLKMIPIHGYNYIKHFAISSAVWWRDYYCPLQARIRRLREQNTGNAADFAFLDQQQSEIDTFNKNRKANESVFMIMQKAAI